MKRGYGRLVQALGFHPNEAGSIPAIRSILIVSVALTLTGCSSWFKKPDPRAACYSECPDLVELRDSTFGATTEKLKEIADQYYNCRKACRGPEKKD